VQAYLDVEMIRGNGVAHATGFAGIPNGDVIRQGTVDLGSGPYVARAFLRYTLPLGGEGRDTLARAMDQVPTIVDARRLEISAGKLAATDYFDLNRYANTTRLQYMNWALFNNTAWDYAADTRGYTNGVTIAWIHPRWTVRVGSFQMPSEANGNQFDPDLRRARGDNAELTVLVPATATVVRLLGYVNHGRMGNYDNAVAIARANRATPDITADRQPGRSRSGVGLNLEQPLADDGETGAFVRLGWSDGRNESFVFTEVDQHVSGGVQVSGTHWGRGADRFGVGAFGHGITSAHQLYLDAGGVGFLLGDGRLAYGPEQGVESYYRWQLGDFVQIGPDVQVIRNPGYNRDRGTVIVTGARFNLRY
jgi:carbohydrate-selective porin OprB